ncbi:leucine-rich repeat-containing protein kinase family protein [Gallionella capsiferriformans]|uniref:Serine/threonine-protein kinase-like domain n=1 Tax=Gallionella capsiferriformans (strain ES-2) TaxID=395494 RepID=D9SJ82_GALCS|nr:leucine-rich repeat-containing protein kinase family protein [Gallionella capsiferriformans]ADL56270.1 Serine/threonine-protein kinase-like domain [Gallionella capsiferriformans ES-2]
MNTLSMLRSGKLAGITRLDLSCGLSEFPPEIFELAETLEILNLSGNALSSLPDDLMRLKKLRVIFCSDNQFTEVPEVLGRCPGLEMVGFKANQISRLSAASLPPALRWLILTDNRLSELPAELGRCSRLQKLMLAGNRLQSLPETMAACRQLELLRISANGFESLPAWLLSLPRLAWLAFAGNPFSDGVESAMEQTKQPIFWHDLEVLQKLGEGASGVIHQANWHKAPVSAVAVKLFKGAVTSDGLPRSEKAACIAAGDHANLISVLGKVSGHPEGTKGLVMPLIDASFKNLAGPPSLESCTRDIYPDDTHFSLDEVLSMARGIADAAAHLHARGILHGDLYAHNMLWNGRGTCLLGDFGAASFMPSGEARCALQRIEVRAFSCYLAELLARCAPHSLLDALRALQGRCAQERVQDRPLFDDVAQALASLHAENHAV